MKIAIVGSGIAGLAAAYRLSKLPDCQITLVERDAQLGLAANTFSRQDDGGQQSVGDLPLRMFNASNWPTLMDLYQEASVAFLPICPSQSFASIPETDEIGKDVDGDGVYLTLGDAMLPKLGTQLLSSRNRHIVSDARRLKKIGQTDLDQGLDPSESFAQYLQRNRYSDDFKYWFLYPTLSSTVCTCSYESLDRYPAVVLLSALNRMTLGEPLQRLASSARDVASRLTAELEDIRLGCTVQAICEHNDHVVIELLGNATERFDRVIVATQANTASRLLSSNGQSPSRLPDGIEYEDVCVTVHRDVRFLPRNKSAWSTFNMGVCDKTSAAMCTVWMNRFFQWESTEDVFQTINPIRQPEDVEAEIHLQRPVVTPASQVAINEFGAFQRSQRPRVLLAGSWAAPGIPLLESGVQSAWAACDLVEAACSVAGN